MRNCTDAKPGCYDLTIEGMSEETKFEEISAANGGESHE